MKAKSLILVLILVMSSLSVGCLDNARRAVHHLTDDDDRDDERCYDENRQEVECDEEGSNYDSDSDEMSQEDCEERGGTWTEAPDREGEYYCDMGEEQSNDDDSAE